MIGLPRLVASATFTARAVLAFGVLVLGLLWLGVAWDLGREKQRALAQAEAEAANLARAFEEHIQRTISGLDQTLLYLKAEYERNPATFDLPRSLASNVILRRVSVQVGVIGPDGVLTDSNVPNFVRVNLSDREHFSFHRDQASQDLFVSKPVLGRASGKWSIQLTRRLDGPHGEFAGVLVVSLDPQYLSQFYGSIDVGALGCILLVGRDGVVRAASNAGGDVVGQSLAPELVSRLFAERAGTQAVTGPLDETPRVAGWRALPNLPLAVWVGRSEADILATMRDSRISDVIAGLMVSMVLGAAILMLYRLVRQQARTTMDLEVKKAELLASRERLNSYVADLERIAEVAAHDMQEPLRRVVSYAQLLSRHAESALDSEGRDYIAQVVDGAWRMRKLVQDLEAFVAVDHMPPVEHAVSSSDALAVALSRLADKLRDSRAEILVDELPQVAADERGLAEIFTQLVDNSLNYASPKRVPVIHVTARTEAGQAVFSVRDNGRGIETRHLKRIFEIFHRLQAVDGRSGTGMGLAIVRRIVEHLGGRVWAESVPGQGSTLFFILPLAAQIGHSDQEAHAA